MAAVGDIIRFVTEFSYLGQRMINRYHYRVDVLVGSDFNVVSTLYAKWFTGVWPSIRSIQSDQCAWVKASAENLSDFQYWESTLAGGDYVGYRTGQGLPSQVTVTFKQPRPAPVYRNGYKRIGGITEDIVSGNSIEASWTDEVANIATELSAPLVYASGTSNCTYQPVIVALNRGTGVVGWYPATSWTYALVGSQNTRKP